MAPRRASTRATAAVSLVASRSVKSRSTSRGPADRARPRGWPAAVRITWRAKIDGLPGAEEAARLQLVAGAGFAECYTAYETFWIDLQQMGPPR